MSALPSGTPAGGLPRDDYERFVTFMRGLVGLDLDSYKRGQMERRIRSFAERRGIHSLDAYARLVAEDEAERNELLDRITINVTQLFRNPEQWQHIGRSILPALLPDGGGHLRAWSAGCSLGAEAYSLAALVRHVAPATRLEIRASDIDRRILDIAQRGEFTDDDARTAPAELLRDHFEALPGGRIRASAELRRAVTFRIEDLLATNPVPGSFDLVLCRNVVIYFTEEARAGVHTMLARSLRPGGYLVVGSTERVAVPLRELGIELVAPFVYRKVAP